MASTHKWYLKNKSIWDCLGKVYRRITEEGLEQSIREHPAPGIRWKRGAKSKGGWELDRE